MLETEAVRSAVPGQVRELAGCRRLQSSTWRTQGRITYRGSPVQIHEDSTWAAQLVSVLAQQTDAPVVSLESERGSMVTTQTAWHRQCTEWPLGVSLQFSSSPCGDSGLSMLMMYTPVKFQ